MIHPPVDMLSKCIAVIISLQVTVTYTQSMWNYILYHNVAVVLDTCMAIGMLYTYYDMP